MIKHLTGFSVIFLLLSLSVSFTGDTLTAFAQQDSDSSLQGTVQIGVLAPLTGDESFAGDEIVEVIKYAESNFNAYLSGIGADWTIELVVRDVMLDPAAALEHTMSFDEMGINTIVGPYTSAQITALKPYTDSNDMLVISYGSTAPSLAIPDDSVLRFIPNDNSLAPIIAKYFADSGITHVVPVWRGDVWGEGLADVSRAEFEAIGGIMDEGIRYNPADPNFDDVTATLSDKVNTLVDEVGADKVGVLVIVFGEITDLLNSAAAHDNLDDVLWAGSAFAQSKDVAGDEISSQFLEDSNMAAIDFTVASTPVTQDVRDTVNGILDRDPSSYALSAYDVVWVLGLSMESADSTDTSLIRQAIPSVLDGYSGTLGSIVLNDAGDLANSFYELWGIEDGTWVLNAVYDPTSDSITRHDVMSDDDKMIMTDKSVTTDTTTTDGNVIQIGVLAQITGDTSETGAEVTTISQYAESKFNEYLDSIGADWTIQAVIEDIGDDPETVASVVEGFDKMGITTVVGPYSSAQTLVVKSYTDYNDMLAISYGSTAPSLAIPYDSIMRFVPDDTNLGPIFAQYLIDSGVTHVVPVWRGDVWGDGLTDITRTEFEALGGTMDEGIRYDPASVDFASVTSELSDKVAAFVDETSVDNVAVLALSFDEVLDLLTLSATHDNLDDVIWTGTPYAKSNKILANDAANSFAESVYLTAIDSAAESNDLTSEINDVISETLGREPVSYALAAYDAIWVYGLAIEAVGSNNVTLVAAEIPSVLEDYSGVLGPITLNEAGDMDNGFYELWRVQDDRWVLYAVYDPVAHSIVMKDDKMMVMDDKGDVAEDIPPAIDDGGGCLIATAAYGSELAPQVQLLREIRSDTLMSSSVGSSFMTEFNSFYYTFSPTVADLQRNNVIFGDTVRTVITPGIYTLGAIMGLADSNEESVLAFGVLSIVALIGLYIAGPVFAVFGVRRLVGKIRSKYQRNRLSTIDN